MTPRHQLLRRTAALAAGIALLATGCGTGAPAGVDDLATDGATHEGDVLEQIRADGVLRVSNTQANPPYSFVDDSTRLCTFSRPPIPEGSKRSSPATLVIRTRSPDSAGLRYCSGDLVDQPVIEASVVASHQAADDATNRSRR